MSDYTPDEWTVRQLYAMQRRYMHNHLSPDYEGEFDRFIAKTKATAWDEAISEAMGQGTIQVPSNPYRKDEGDE